MLRWVSAALLCAGILACGVDEDNRAPPPGALNAPTFGSPLPPPPPPPPPVDAAVVEGGAPPGPGPVFDAAPPPPGAIQCPDGTVCPIGNLCCPTPTVPISYICSPEPELCP